MPNDDLLQSLQQLSILDRDYNKSIMKHRNNLSGIIKKINPNEIDTTLSSIKAYNDNVLSAIYRNDSKLDFFKESLYPLAKFSLAAGLVFSFGLIQVVLPYVAVVSFLLFSSAFFASNLYQKGLFDANTTGFGLTSAGGILCLLATAGLITLPVSSPMLLATSAALLCGFAVYRGYLRSTEAKGSLNQEIEDTIETILKLEETSKDTNFDDKTQKKIQELIDHLFVVLRCKMVYQTNLVRTIKNPFDKYFNQLTLLKKRKNMLQHKIPANDENCMASRILNDVNCCSRAMKNTLIRDIPWLFVNIALVSLSFMLPAVAVLGFKVTLPILLITLVGAVVAGATAYGLKAYQALESGNKFPDIPQLQAPQNKVQLSAEEYAPARRLLHDSSERQFAETDDTRPENSAEEKDPSSIFENR